MNVFDTPQVLSLVISTVLPLLVALVTKASWNRALKGAVLLGLSVVSAFLSEWYSVAVDHQVFHWAPAIVTALLGFGVGVASHEGLLKDSQLQQMLLASLVKDGPRPVPPSAKVP